MSIARELAARRGWSLAAAKHYERMLSDQQKTLLLAALAEGTGEAVRRALDAIADEKLAEAERAEATTHRRVTDQDVSVAKVKAPAKTPPEAAKPDQSSKSKEGPRSRRKPKPADQGGSTKLDQPPSAKSSG